MLPGGVRELSEIPETCSAGHVCTQRSVMPDTWVSHLFTECRAARKAKLKFEIHVDEKTMKLRPEKATREQYLSYRARRTDSGSD